MSRTPKSDFLLASWRHDQEPATDPPHQIIWGDGAEATYDDYRDHMSDTHTWVVGPQGIELRIFPNIVADVIYDRVAETWVIEGVSSTHTALGVSDPNATDSEITAALYT